MRRMPIAMKWTGWPLPVCPLLALIASRPWLAGRYCQIPATPPGLRPVPPRHVAAGRKALALAAALKSCRPYHPAASYLYCCIPKSFCERMILDRNESIWRLHVISSPDTTTRIRHPGPPLGIVATIFVVLFNAGLYPVTAFGGNPVFPVPAESAPFISAFFPPRPSAVFLSPPLPLASAIPLC